MSGWAGQPKGWPVLLFRYANPVQSGSMISIVLPEYQSSNRKIIMSQPNTNIRPFTWGDIEFSETIMIDGIQHVTRRAIGEFLEYAEATKQISKIIERNSHILEFQLSSVVTTTDGKNYDTFIYDPVGFLLIVMQSDQPKAIDMKIAIAKFVRYFSKKPAVTAKEQRIIRGRITSLVKSIVDETDQVSVKVHWEEIRYLCDQIGCSYPEIHLMRKGWTQLTLVGGYDVLMDGRNGGAK
jgi:hypothetical protein